MRRPLALMGLLLVTILAACSPGAGGSSDPSVSSGPPASATSSVSASAEPTASGTPIVRRALPAGFPVLAGAVAVPLPDDDQGLIARWTSDVVGTPAYDYYVEALPAAGYPIEGLYPGDAYALIRFAGPGHELWQLVLHAADLSTTEIEVRLDRP